MGPAIHPDRRGEMDAVGATPTSELFVNTTTPQGKIAEMSSILEEIHKIEGVYGSKEKNASGMVPMSRLENLFDMMETDTRQNTNVITP